MPEKNSNTNKVKVRLLRVSAFKFALIFGILGFLSGLIFGLFAFMIGDIILESAGIGGSAGSFGFAMVIFTPLVFFISNFIIGLISAGITNLCLKLVEGLDMVFLEK